MARTVNLTLATREHLASAANRAATLEKRRTAAYARVSTDKDEQETSFEATSQLLHRLHHQMPRLDTNQTLHGRGHHRLFHQAL